MCVCNVVKVNAGFKHSCASFHLSLYSAGKTTACVHVVYRTLSTIID